jgi:pimeloyl-ACP methyl ester carboxylesterase
MTDAKARRIFLLLAGILIGIAGLAGCLQDDTHLQGGHWTEVNGHRLYYERYGSGRPLLLLHGGGESVHSSFGPVLLGFVAKHDVIAPEQVGQGHTPDIPGPLTYSAMMEDTAALLMQLGVQDADVVGWSDGGNIALMLALRYPKLVRRVVVSGANFAPEGLNEAEIADTREQLKQWNASDPNGFDAKLLKMWLISPTKLELSTELLAKIDKPTLVMVGDQDAIRLEHTIKLYRSLPKGQLCILPDTGHATFQDRPVLSRTIIERFLNAVME